MNNEWTKTFSTNATERHWHQWPALPLPLVSSTMRTNLLIMGDFMRNFFLIIICGICSSGEIYGADLNLPAMEHASVLTSKGDHCFLWSQDSPSQTTTYPKPKSKTNTGGGSGGLLGTPNQWPISGSNFKYSWWWKARTSAEKRDLSGIADPYSDSPSTNLSKSHKQSPDSVFGIWPFLCRIRWTSHIELRVFTDMV